MSTKDKKDINEEMFDHMIKYGTSEWADDISPDDIPEEDLSDQLNQKMDTMFASARKKANRKHRFITARRVAAVFLVFLTMASVTVMSVEAFRVPVLNFIFERSNKKDQLNISIKDKSPKDNYIFNYLPAGYKFKEKTVYGTQKQCVYEYSNVDNSIIYIIIQSQVDYDYYLDIDKSSYSKISLNHKTYYFMQNTYSELFWYQDKYLIRIKAKISKQEFLKIAENIKIN